MRTTDKKTTEQKRSNEILSATVRQTLIPQWLNARFVGLGFLWAWIYGAFFTDALTLQDLEDTSLTEGFWIISLAAISLTLLASTLLERYLEPHLKSPVLRIGAPLFIMVGTLSLALATITNSTVQLVLGYTGAIITGMGAGVMWLMWAEVYSCLDAEKTEAYIPIAALLSMALFFLLSNLIGWIALISVIAMPALSAVFLQLGSQDEVISQANRNHMRRADDPGPLPWKLALLLAILWIGFSFMRATVVPESTSGFALSFSSAFLAGGMIAFIATIALVVFARHVSFFAVYRWTIPVICLSFLLLIALPVEYRTVAYACNFAAMIGLDMQLWILFADRVRKGINSPLRIFGWGRFAGQGGAAIGALGGIILIQELQIDLALVSIALITLTVPAVMIALSDPSFANSQNLVEPQPMIVLGDPDGSYEDALEQKCGLLTKHYNLSVRESEVLLLMARGRNLPYIRDVLVISRNTVNTHIKHIYSKLGIHSRTELLDMIESL